VELLVEQIIVEVPDPLTVVGLKTHAVPLGTPLGLSVTGLLKPPEGVTVIV
jgi:hypothetical protein